MKKRIGFYVAAWAVLLAAFNVIAFLQLDTVEYAMYTSSFWIGYSFVTVAFLGQLACALIAFRADSARKMFYNLSLILTSYTGLMLSFVVGIICMIVALLPYWVAAAACTVILAMNVVSVIKANVAITEVERLDKKIKADTFFIKSLTVDADTLMAKAKSDEVRAECKKVYEAIRFSDPMSSSALASAESQITVKFSEFSEAVNADNAESASDIAKELTILIGDRNKKCMLLK